MKSLAELNRVNTKIFLLLPFAHKTNSHWKNKKIEKIRRGSGRGIMYANQHENQKIIKIQNGMSDFYTNHYTHILCMDYMAKQAKWILELRCRVHNSPKTEDKKKRFEYVKIFITLIYYHHHHHHHQRWSHHQVQQQRPHHRLIQMSTRGAKR